MKSVFKQIIIFLLTKEAQAVLRKYKPKIVAITGTVGKTSTKDAVYTALSQFEYVAKSPKSFNSEFGVPLAILGQVGPSQVTDLFGWSKIILEGVLLLVLPNHYPKWLVLEVGTDRPGDIAELTEWLRPDVVIVTRLSQTPVHVENFGGIEELFREKGNLVRALKTGGTLILNAEDKDVMAYKDLTKEKVITFGQGENYEVVYNNNLPTGIKFEVDGQTVSITGTLGEQHIQHVAVAMAVAKLLGENLGVVSKALSGETPAPGRMRLVPGLKGSTIIDDSYNSSPVALEEALKTVKTVKAKRKVVVLGDMLELGRFSVDEHKNAGLMANKSADVLVTVGIRSKAMEGDHHFSDSREAAKFMKDFVEEGDLVLVKGSQGVRMERVVEALMAHPRDKEKLLVRQEKEWKMR